MIKLMPMIILVVFVLTACETSRGKNDEPDNNITNTMDRMVEENGIPGMNFSIIYRDGVQKDYSSGYADIENKTAMSTDRLMFSGSVGKTYCVAVIMQLYEEGKLNIRDRVVDYVPDSSWLKAIPNINDITIEMCLKHTTGLPRYAFYPAVWDSLHENPDKVWSYQDRLLVVFGEPALHQAGKAWAYSDTNYLLLGMLIEKITGEYYYDVVAERILTPLELSNTVAADTRDIKNLAQGYSRLPVEFNMPEKMVENGRFIFNPQMEWTGGGFVSTTSDLAKWAKYYYSDYPFSDSIHQKIITPTIYALEAEDTDPYGMGSFIFPSKHGKAYGHTGFFPGYNSIFAFFPEGNIAVALQINCDYAAEKMSLLAYLDELLDAAKTF